MADRVRDIPETLLRRKKVQARVGLSRSSIYERMADGTFPRPIKLGKGRSVAWLESEIDLWIKQKIEQSRQGKVEA